MPQSLEKIVNFLENNDYDFIRLNLLTYFERSNRAYSLIEGIKHFVDYKNATPLEKMEILMHTQTLSGNILKRDKIDFKGLEETLKDRFARWFVHMHATARMMDNFAYLPYAYIVHTWENTIYWDDQGDKKKGEYSDVAEGAGRVIEQAKNVLDPEVFELYFFGLDLNKKMYPFAYKYISKKHKIRLVVRHLEKNIENCTNISIKKLKQFFKTILNYKY